MTWAALPDRSESEDQLDDHPSDHNVAAEGLNAWRGIQFGTFEDVVANDDANNRTTITFPKPYASTPIVFVNYLRANTGYYLQGPLNSVTTTSFNVRNWRGQSGLDMVLNSNQEGDLHWVAFGELA